MCNPTHLNDTTITVPDAPRAYTFGDIEKRPMTPAKIAAPQRPHPVAAMCDAIERGVAVELLEKLAALSADFVRLTCAELPLGRASIDWQRTLDALQQVQDQADEWLAEGDETVRIEVDAAYGSVT